MFFETLISLSSVLQIAFGKSPVGRIPFKNKNLSIESRKEIDLIWYFQCITSGSLFGSSLQTGNLRSLTCIPRCWGKQGKPETDVHVGSFCKAPKSPLPSINLQPLAGNKSLKSKDIKACHYQLAWDALRVHQSLYSDFQPMA